MNIFRYIDERRNDFDRQIDVNGWPWSFREHIRQTFFYKHGRLLNGNDEDTPVKNITRPLLNLQYRAEDIDVKDVLIYVDDPKDFHLSFLVKKYHDDVFIPESGIDDFIDELKQQKIDYGVGIAKKRIDAKPDVMPLESVVFCDQTNILSGPIGFLHNLAPHELLEKKEVGWGNPNNGATISLEELVMFAEASKSQTQDNINNNTPGVYIEVIEIHGPLPTQFLDDSEPDGTYTYQMQIVGFYKDDKGNKHGVILYRKKSKPGNIEIVQRDKIFGRCAGFGAAEEVFENQVWTNNDVIRIKEMLDAASKVILQTTDSALAARHPTGLKNLDNLALLQLDDGKQIGQIDLSPRSMALFEKSLASWQEHAERTSGATEALMGESPASGTPFALQEFVAREGKGLHDYRRKKYARDLERMYKNWFIPHIIEKITQGTRFLSELSTDELRSVAKAMAIKATNDITRKATLGRMEQFLQTGEIAGDPNEEIQQRRANFEEQLMQDNRKFIEILKGDFNKKPLRVKVSVAGASKNIAQMTSGLVNIFRQIISNPQGFQQMMAIPEMANNFNQILELSGFSPLRFTPTFLPQAQEKTPARATPELEGEALAGKVE
jgi:hypothetical protein